MERRFERTLADASLIQHSFSDPLGQLELPWSETANRVAEVKNSEAEESKTDIVENGVSNTIIALFYRTIMELGQKNVSSGGPAGSRTPDLSNANAALYQLSYWPIFAFEV